jgi:hypothetical protein
MFLAPSFTPTVKASNEGPIHPLSHALTVRLMHGSCRSPAWVPLELEQAVQGIAGVASR